MSTVCNHYVGIENAENDEQQAIDDSNFEGGYGFEQDDGQERQPVISDVGEGLSQNNFEDPIDLDDANDMRFKRGSQSIYNNHD
jgi:hypothetical protein